MGDLGQSLAISDAARVLFPRSRVETDKRLAQVLLPRHVHDGSARSGDASFSATRSRSHEDFFRSDRDSRLKRGVNVRRHVNDLLRQCGRLDESHRNGEPLERVLHDAMDISRQYGDAQFISPGLIEPPHVTLRQEYVKRGWRRPGVVWSNFRPSLLKITYVEANRTWRLEVIDVKSTQARSVPTDEQDSMFDDEAFKVQAYRHFIRLLVSDLAATKPFFRHLAVSRAFSIWRYTGCYSRHCNNDNFDCFLNGGIINLDGMENRLRVPAQAATPWIKRQLYTRVPLELGCKT